MSISMHAAIRGALSGKTIGRTIFNEEVRQCTVALKGQVLDLAGGASPSYLPLLPNTITLTRTDLRASPGVRAVDINQPLPFRDASFDSVFLFSALYAVEDPAALAREVRRVLKPGGMWFISSPFIANEMPEPHDYLRFSAEGLERLLRRGGFESVEITRMGDRASAAVQLLHPFFLFRGIRALVFPFAVLVDRLIPKSVRRAHPAPIAYFVRAV